MKNKGLAATAALATLLPLGGGFPIANQMHAHAAMAAAPVKGGTAIDGLFEEPTSLLPNTGFDAFNIGVQETLFSPLFYTDGKGQLHPGLAAKIPTLANGGISKDGLTYSFTLRPGLKWSDGKPLDARDVDYSWKIWTDKGLIVNSTFGFDHIKSAVISSDNLSITFHLKSVFAPFLSVWVDQVMPLPAHILQGLTAKQINTNKFLFQPTVSSGPFSMTSRKSGENIVEQRNPNFYMPGRPYLDKLIFKIIPDQTGLINALRAHEIDSAWFLDVSQINTLKNISGYTFLAAPAPNYEQAVLNFRNPILQDVRVRQALEYGLDRPTMVKDVWHGAAQLIASDQVSTAFSYDPSVKPFPYDPAKAASLLDAAGWKLGSDKLRHKNGKTLSLRWTTTTRNPWRAQDEFIALQGYQNLGIQLNIVNYPGSTYFGSIFPSGNFDIGEWENGLVYDPDNTIAPYFSSTAFPPHGSNFGHYANPAYDALIKQEEATVDPVKRKAIFAKMQRIMNQDVPALWMYGQNTPSEYNNNLHNYAPGPYSYELWNTWDWWKS
ncbi:MAG: peptide transporter substrate-binding protein [Chloroflexi bacterium]|nr:peptide transporter substrate-binding protein [Chloroflexota bacterium]